MPKTVTFTGDQISKQPQSLYEKMLQPLADKWDTDIVVISCHGRYDVVPAELTFDKLYIFAQLLPREFEGIAKATIKGYKINGEELVFPVKVDPKNPSNSPCPQGDTLSFKKAPTRTKMILDDNGNSMAVILDGSIYIMNDFIHSRGKEDFDAGSKQLSYVLDYAVGKEGLLDALKSGVEDKSKAALETALRLQFTTRLEKELIQLKAARDTVSEYEKGITDCVRKIVSAEKIVESIRKNIDDVPTALDKTWKNVRKMSDSPAYSNVSFTKSSIKAITAPVVIDHEKVQYDMGRFEVTLNFNGTCTIINLDKKIDNYDHPHINNGTVCWGNFAGWIPKLIGSSEFDVALDQVFTFLCHYDAGSPYKKLDAWPKVTVKKPTAKAATKTQEAENELEILL